jgi:large subunit ribosomal protein L22
VGTQVGTFISLRFSSSSRKEIAEDVKGLYEQARNKTYEKLGLKTPNEKQIEAVLESMKPNPEKTLARLHRKRYGRPQKVLNQETGEIQERILEHKYSTAHFRISHRKLKLLADQIGGGKPIDYSILQMKFSEKRASRRIMNTLSLARDHAIAKGMDVTKMVVAEAWVGKGRTIKKIEFKGRGRIGIRKSFYAKLSVILREGKSWETKQKEKLEEEKKRVRRIGTAGVVRTNRPVINTHQRAGWQW